MEVEFEYDLFEVQKSLPNHVTFGKDQGDKAKIRFATTSQRTYHLKRLERNSIPPYVSKETYPVFLNFETELNYLTIRQCFGQLETISPMKVEPKFVWEIHSIF